MLSKKQEKDSNFRQMSQSRNLSFILILDVQNKVGREYFFTRINLKGQEGPFFFFLDAFFPLQMKKLKYRKHS